MLRHLVSSIACALLLFGAVILPHPARGQQPTVQPAFYAVDPIASFLRVSLFDQVRAPTVVDLRAVAPGAYLHLFPRGKFTVGPGGSGAAHDQRIGSYPFVGIFGSSTTLLDVSVRERVPEVVSAGGVPAFVSRPSFYGGYATDVSGDFRIVGDVFTLIRPIGANHLFLGVEDDYYADNETRAPESFGVWLAASVSDVPPADPAPGNCVRAYDGVCPSAPSVTTPEPATLALTGVGLLAVLGVRHRRARRSPGWRHRPVP